MIIPHGLKAEIARRAGIKKQNVSRSLRAGNQTTVEVAKTVIAETISNKQEIESLLDQLSKLKADRRKRVKPATQKPGKMWYSVQEAAEALSISTDTVMRRIKGQGKVKWDSDLVVQQGRVWRINQAIILNGGK